MFKKEIEVVKENKDMVVKSNELIESSYKIPINAQRILLMAISKINPRNDKFNEVTLDQNEISDLFFSSEKSSKRKDIRKILDLGSSELMSSYFITRDKDDWEKTSWVTKCTYSRSRNEIKIQFHDEMKPFLLSIKERFTGYPIKSIKYLNSSVQIRLYELCLQYKSIGQRTISVDSLRFYLGIEKGKNIQIGHFKNRVIEPSIQQINKTNINVTYEYVKENKKVVGFIFFITEVIQEKKDVELDSLAEIVLELISYNVKKEKAIEIADCNEEEYIRAKIDFAESKFIAGTVKNLTGFLISSIENDFKDKKPDIHIKRSIDEQKKRDQLNETEEKNKKKELDKLELIQKLYAGEKMNSLLEEFIKANKNNKFLMQKYQFHGSKNVFVKKQFSLFLLTKFKDF